MPEAVLLTVPALKAKKAGEIVKDRGGLTGTMRETRSGLSVTFNYQYRFKQRRREMACGTWPAKSLAEIRRVRDDARKLVSAGVDPLEQREKERLDAEKQRLDEIEAAKAAIAEAEARAAAGVTVKTVYEKWLGLLKREASSRAELVRVWEGEVLPTLGSIPVRAVTRKNVLDVTDAMQERGVQRLALRTFNEIRQFFRFAYQREYVDIDPTARIDKNDLFKKDVVRDRVLDKKQIRTLASALPNAGLKDTTRLSIPIMLATLCRVGELSRALWSNVDLDTGVWKIPAEDSKNRHAHLIFLSDFAIARFEELKAITGNRKFCYPSDDEENHIDTKAIAKQVKDRQRSEEEIKDRIKRGVFTKRTNKYDALLFGEPWTPHDLRRSGATRMGELGVTSDVIERCLNHVETNGAEGNYQHQKQYAQQREAWQQLGEELHKLFASNVIPLKTKQHA
ncbi:site-specific integrase [Caballeronia sp. dw_276]|uniref:tyrosine-type recombinase/integrase n=1 Tax=Caballeronia sp. dw_276 TaxID=2719795 RepID=UPI001BD31E0D|nr:site-specific integrase [Caballeronia sp. dw_276]